MERRTSSNTPTSLRGAIGEAIAIGVGAIGAIDTAIGDHAIATGVRGIATGVRVTIGARVACGGVRGIAIGDHAIIGLRAIVCGGDRASTGARVTGGDSNSRNKYRNRKGLLTRAFQSHKATALTHRSRVAYFHMACDFSA